VQFSDCTFENARLATSNLLYRDRPEFPVRVRGGTAHYGLPDLAEDTRREDWGAEYAAEVTGIRFLPGIPRCTVGDLIRVLDLYRPPEGKLVGGVYSATNNRAGPDRFWLALVGPQGQRDWVAVQLRDGRMTELPRLHDRPRSNDPGQVLRCEPLVRLLRTVPPETACLRADFSWREIDGAGRPVVELDEHPPTILDGQTGERLRLP
jgi:hypothetical protein